MHNRKTSNGFTLVEILIVVAIIGILAAVAVPAYFNHVLRTRQAEAYHNLLDIKAAQEMHHSMYNEYAGLITAGTFSSLLSFDSNDSTYYTYLILSASGTVFEARAVGQGKLSGDVFSIKDDQDPCIVSLGNVKLNLGLDDCP